MALQHFVENYKPDINVFKATVNKRKITESELKSLASLNSLKLNESVKKYFEQHPVATLEGKDVYRLPISRYDWENDNGRVYEKRLWQRVIDEQKEAYQGNVGLADHPEDDDSGKFKEAAIVWLSMGLDESGRIVWGEGIFVGDNGRLAEEVMSAGGRVGFSTSGFGELDESDKKTVRWDSYQLERPADIVLNPSQKVYGRSENRMARHEAVEETDPNLIQEFSTPPKAKSSTGSSPNWKCPCGKEITGKPIWADGIRTCSEECANKYADEQHGGTHHPGLNEPYDKKKENAPMSSETKLSKLEERKFRRDVGVFLEEADKIADPKEKLAQLEEITAYFSEGIAPDLKEKVDAEIKKANETIEKAVKEHGKLVETFGIDNVEALKEGVKKVAVDTQLFERDAEEWQEIATGLQEKVQKLQAILNTRPTIEAYKTSLAFSKRMKETFKKKEEELISIIEKMKSDAAKQDLIEQQMVKELAKISKTNETLTIHNEQLREYGEKVRGIVLEYRARDTANEEMLQEQAEDSKKVKVQPTKTAPVFSGFSEKKELASYYLDLIKRYGEKMIAPYKDRILGAKTLGEGMKLWINIMAEAGTERTTRVTDALEPEERQKLIESQTNTRIKKQSEFQSRLPKTNDPNGEGWV